MHTIFLQTVYELFRLHNSSLDVSKGHMIQARILSIDKRKVTLDTGIAIAKVAVTDITPDCILKPIDDKKPRKLGEIRVGDVVQVFLERKETPEGDMLVSGQQAAVQRRVRAVWKELQNRMHNDKKVKGRILNAVSGGFAVGVGGLVCFLPNSMATKATSRKVGELQYFRILQMNPARSNVVLQDWAFHAWKAKPSGNVKRQNVKMEADSLLKDVQKL
jgi:small subunit ribosomal protein S1